MTTPEINQNIVVPQPEQAVQERPQTMEIPPEVERATGVKPVQTQITAKVTDDAGKPMMQSPATQTITITLPASTEQLDIWAKGSPNEALTWLAGFWLRLVKKAMYFGWNVVTGGRSTQIN
jgi:hypothetical protein